MDAETDDIVDAAFAAAIVPAENILLGDFYEDILLNCVNYLHPLDTAAPDVPLSYLGILLYAHGCAHYPPGSRYPHGLIYKDNHAIFGVSVHFQPEKPRIPCIRIVAPRQAEGGKLWRESVDAFAAKAKRRIPNADIVIIEADISLHSLSVESYMRGH